MTWWLTIRMGSDPRAARAGLDRRRGPRLAALTAGLGCALLDSVERPPAQPRERDHGDRAGQPVVHDHEEHDQEQPDRPGDEAALHRVLTEGRLDTRGLDDVERHRQRTGVDEVGELLRRIDREAALDDAFA